MSLIDHHAGNQLRSLREHSGRSPEALAHDIADWARSKGWDRGVIHPFTIRRIEKGFVPTVRVQFILAGYFEKDMRDIWRPEMAVRVETKTARNAMRA